MADLDHLDLDLDWDELQGELEAYNQLSVEEPLLDREPVLTVKKLVSFKLIPPGGLYFDVATTVAKYFTSFFQAVLMIMKGRVLCGGLLGLVWAMTVVQVWFVDKPRNIQESIRRSTQIGIIDPELLRALNVHKTTLCSFGLIVPPYALVDVQLTYSQMFMSIVNMCLSLKGMSGMTMDLYCGDSDVQQGKAVANKVWGSCFVTVIYTWVIAVLVFQTFFNVIFMKLSDYGPLCALALFLPVAMANHQIWFQLESKVQEAVPALVPVEIYGRQWWFQCLLSQYTQGLVLLIPTCSSPFGIPQITREKIIGETSVPEVWMGDIPARLHCFAQFARVMVMSLAIWCNWAFVMSEWVDPTMVVLTPNQTSAVHVAMVVLTHNQTMKVDAPIVKAFLLGCTLVSAPIAIIATGLLLRYNRFFATGQTHPKALCMLLLARVAVYYKFNPEDAQ